MTTHSFAPHLLPLIKSVSCTLRLAKLVSYHKTLTQLLVIFSIYSNNGKMNISPNI